MRNVGKKRSVTAVALSLFTFSPPFRFSRGVVHFRPVDLAGVVRRTLWVDAVLRHLRRFPRIGNVLALRSNILHGAMETRLGDFEENMVKIIMEKDFTMNELKKLTK